MSIATRLDQIHFTAKQNKWLRYFYVFNRCALAAGFIPSGLVKIMGERFTALSNNHPMGHYLEALHNTGYYYPFIGVLQVTAALLLLIPRTAMLGALLYFPIILNICVLSLAVRFEGSLLSSPLMVLANLFVICWNYDKIKYIFPFSEPTPTAVLVKQLLVNHKFPFRFFAGAFVTVVIVVAFISNIYQIMPRNTLKECKSQFVGTNRTKAGNHFCDCIHLKGEPLAQAIAAYEKGKSDR